MLSYKSVKAIFVVQAPAAGSYLACALMVVQMLNIKIPYPTIMLFSSIELKDFALRRAGRLLSHNLAWSWGRCKADHRTNWFHFWRSWDRVWVEGKIFPVHSLMLSAHFFFGLLLLLLFPWTFP